MIDTKLAELLSKRERGNRLEPTKPLDVVQTSTDLLCLHLRQNVSEKKQLDVMGRKKNAQQMVLSDRSRTQAGQGEAKSH